METRILKCPICNDSEAIIFSKYSSCEVEFLPNMTRKKSNRKPILGIDVDLTIVDTLNPWLEWYESQTGHRINLSDLPEDQYSIHHLMDKHDNPMEFWGACDLYDNLCIFPEAVRVIQKLSELVDIVFISHCVPSHIESKLALLERFLGKKYPFIDTEYKQFVKVDFFVDDNVKMLDNMHESYPETVIFKWETQVNKAVSRSYWIPCKEWAKIEDIVIFYLK